MNDEFNVRGLGQRARDPDDGKRTPAPPQPTSREPKTYPASDAPRIPQK